MNLELSRESSVDLFGHHWHTDDIQNHRMIRVEIT